MTLNDVAIFMIAIANLMLRVWEMRKYRRNDSDGTDQPAN